MKYEITRDQYDAIKQLSDNCSNSFPPPFIEGFTINPEFEKFVNEGISYFDEKMFDVGMRNILGDEIVELSKTANIQLVVVKYKGETVEPDTAKMARIVKYLQTQKILADNPKHLCIADLLHNEKWRWYNNGLVFFIEGVLARNKINHEEIKKYL